MKRKRLYKKYISDVALDISCDNEFRQKLFSAPFGARFEISAQTAPQCEYLREVFERGLVYYVTKVHAEQIREKFDEGLVIFKFTASEFPDVLKYSANNFGDFKLR